MFPQRGIYWTLGPEWEFNETFSGCLPESWVTLNTARRAALWRRVNESLISGARCVFWEQTRCVRLWNVCRWLQSPGFRFLCSFSFSVASPFFFCSCTIKDELNLGVCGRAETYQRKKPNPLKKLIIDVSFHIFIPVLQLHCDTSGESKDLYWNKTWTLWSCHV